MPLDASSPGLDALLLGTALELELSERDHRVASKRYALIPEHLQRPVSPLHLYMDDALVYAQGSRAIGATIVHGADDDRFDLDAILEFQRPSWWTSISAQITDDRVRAALDTDDVSIWEIRSCRFGTSVLRNEGDLSRFRMLVGQVFDEIRQQHGVSVELSVFPAIPAACAIEFSRVWQPKAHPRFAIYDETQIEGYLLRHSIGAEESA